MLRYILKRLLIFIPTLILISVLSFFLSQMAPGDPVLSYMELDGEEISLDMNSNLFIKNYRQVYEAMHFDKPSFYFSISSSNYPKTDEFIILPKYQKLYSALLDQHIDYKDVYNYIQSITAFENYLLKSEKENHAILVSSTQRSSKLSMLADRWIILFERLSINTKSNHHRLEIINAIASMDKNKSNFIFPRLRWHGMNNQYQHWINSFFSSTPLRSYNDGISVFIKLKKSLKWTLIMVIPGLLISFILSIIIGVYSARKPDYLGTKIMIGFNYFMYSIPLFWLATILLLLASASSIFIGSGILIRPEDSIAKHFIRMILPITVIVLHNMAYISRQMFHSMNKQNKLDYSKTARAKGVSASRIVWIHQFRNALIPMITMMTASIPAALGGSVVLELIYNIPGMGRLMYQAIGHMDWPVVFSCLLFLSILAMFFLLLGDILYALINPKIRFDGN